MAEISVDMSQAVEFKTPNDGAYECVIEVKPEQFESEDKSTPCLKWEMKIADVEDQEEFAGQNIWRNTPIIGKGSGFTKEMLNAFQIPFTEEGEGDEAILRFDDDDCIDKRALVSGKQKEWNGSMNFNVTKVVSLETDDD